MRISDWSSDVCSSDLQADPHQAGSQDPGRADDGRGEAAARCDPLAQAPGGAVGRLRRGAARRRGVGAEGQRYRQQADAAADRARQRRSEEHTSELQSLMRISYAVFCLKKKNTRANTTTTSQPKCIKMIP